MNITEIFASAIVSQLVEDLASSSTAYSFLPYGGIDENLKQWGTMLSRIKAVLGDSEDRQFTEPSVQEWLHDVQNLVYDIEDFVDDFASEARGSLMIDDDEPESSRPSKLRKFFVGVFSSITRTSNRFSPAMNLRISLITNKLERIEGQKNNLGLRENVSGRFERTTFMRDPSTSLVGPALVYGREEEIATILTWLVQDKTNDHDDGRVRIMSIVGMGGIGKTTLAQSIYNNERVKDWFSDRVWVCVTEDFDVLNISKIIYEALYEKSCEFNDLNKIQEKVMEKLSIKRFLLVLDDVWNEDYAKWYLLCAPFHARATESMVIATTRSHKVAQTMGSREVYELNELSDGVCLSILAQHALQRPNFDGHPKLKEVGMVIAKQCKGLPLAAKSLGGFLRTKPSSRQWTEVSTSKIWELQNDAIIPALRLSYHHLPPDLKPLFVYCSLFPKGYEFDKQELIILWMAQGFLKQSSGEQNQMEELGSEYFDELLSRSFFQLSTANKSRYIMHDLNNDLAQFVAGLTYLRLDDKIVSNGQYNISEEARHASFVSHKYTDFNKFKALNAARCLRTLLPIRDRSFNHSCLSSLVLKNFPRLPYLRALSFKGYNICEVPKPIGDLNHLRYLDFSETNITKLPKSICELYSLQTLLLHGCRKLVQLPSSIHELINLRYLDISGTWSLKEMPASIYKLINLRHLHIVDTPRLKEMPKGIGMLNHLRTLSKFIIDKRDGGKISELKGLHHLKGTLSIFGIQNVMTVQDAVEANLFRKNGLHGLKLKWGCTFEDAPEKGLELEVFDALKPSIGLTSLKNEFYGGLKFPSWIGDSSFCDMGKLRLIDCKNCAYLPPLGQLTSLKELYIEGLYGVKIVGPEFLGVGSPHSNAFPSLVILSFKNMDNWEEWFAAYFTKGDENFEGAFPCLLELQLSGLRKLKKVSLPEIPSIGSLKIRGCSKAVLRSMVGFGTIKNLELHNVSGLIKLDEGIIGCLREVENLSVSWCYQLRYLWEEEVACKVFEKMKSLIVKGCEQLESLGDEEQLLPHNLESLYLWNCGKLEKMPKWQNNLTSLKRLSIYDCHNLQDNMASTAHGEYEYSNLESISISLCPNLKWFPTGKKIPTTLRDLTVRHCENMEETEEEKKGLSLSLLESVYLFKWSKLKTLPQGLAHLTRLYISGCSSIESIPETSLPPTLLILVISDCINLKYMCTNEMQSLTSLQQLTITWCNNLESYPSGGRWPPNLEYLCMGDVKKPIKEWGLATLPTSLRTLRFDGNFPQLTSFTEVGTHLITTATSLTCLQISSLKNLECVRKGLENLSSLQHLKVCCCPKLRELPETLFPTLSSLEIEDCPVVSERCKRKRGYWPKISHIPCLKIDYKFVWEF